MLYHLLVPLSDTFNALNLFRYITFRSGGAVMTALVISFLLGPAVIRWLKRKQREGQPIRLDGPESHLLTKKGTPTMGGVLILLAMVLATLLWADLRSGLVWAALLVTVAYGGLGFADDWLKVTKRNTKGVSGRMKLLVQAGIGFVAATWIWWLHPPAIAGGLSVPVFKEVLIPFGLAFPLIGMVVMMGASNAVNLTDGLDGLAIVPVMFAGAAFGVISYLVGRFDYSQYLAVHFVPGVGELAIICGALIGAGTGFLWYNAPPAKIFMGDTGSLALGGALGSIAVATKHEIVLGIAGGLFVAEALSVMVQIASFKLTGKRVFRMAPIHHHYEKVGWAESTVVIRFWIISAMLALAGLATLKLR